MNEVDTNRTLPSPAALRGGPDGKPARGDGETESMAARICNGSCSEHDRGKADGGEIVPQESPRIQIDVPMGTSYKEIQECVFRQAWQLAGTQLRAAVALGITPETLSRFLRRCNRERISSPRVPEAWPVVAVNQPIGSSCHRVIEPSSSNRAEEQMNQVEERMNQVNDEPREGQEELKTGDGTPMWED
jgi:hypothetical protein